ncbi:Protein of unknown function [Pyronema omphalodes CBS 100304]|uniref:Uncharacterized protein n=1 Tax=Pyronema omphalodes (strain CBS 100304) TaxID=1076935 RepID=U4LX13_PYROM|nr:Protein of unknown function [Pyronema omphalodes CBS 100304]
MGCHETLMSRRKKSSRPKPSFENAGHNAYTPVVEQKKSLTPTVDLPRDPRDRYRRWRNSHLRNCRLWAYQLMMRIDNLRTSRARKRHSFQGLDQLTANGNPFGDFTGNIPLVLDDSSHVRSFPCSEIKPNDGKITSAYEAERDRNPHIATQDRCYELQAALDKSDIPRISHESTERVERLLNSAGRPISDIGSSKGFKLDEAPENASVSVGGISPPETAAPSPPRDSIVSIPPRRLL